MEEKTVETPSSVCIRIIGNLANVRNNNAREGIQTERSVYESALKECESIFDTKIRDMAIYAIKYLQSGYLPESKDDFHRKLEEIKVNIPSGPAESFERRMLNMLVFQLLLAVWQSVKVTNGDLDDICQGSFASVEMKVVLNYLRGLEVDESVAMPAVPAKAKEMAKEHLYTQLKELSSFCRAINSDTGDETAIKVIEEVQTQGKNKSATEFVKGLDVIYPDGAIISIRHEPDGKKCEVVVVLRGSRTNLGNIGDWYSCLYGGNFNFGWFTNISEHYGYHLRSNHIYDKVRDAVSNKVGGKQVRFVFAGHSQGGALATLLARRFEKEKGLKVTGIFLYTFGSPTPLRNAPDAYKLSGVRHYRFNNAWDPAPEAFRVLNHDYCHFGAANPLPMRRGSFLSGHGIETYANNIAVETELMSTNYIGNYITTLTPDLWTGEQCRPWAAAAAATAIALSAVVVSLFYRNKHVVACIAKRAFGGIKSGLSYWRQGKRDISEKKM